MEKCKKCGTVVAFWATALILALYLYKVAAPSADDYGSLVVPFAEDMYGYTIYNWSDLTAVSFLVRILYGIFGMSDTTYCIWFAIWFLICCVCTIYIAVGKFCVEKLYIIPLILYIFIPYSGTNVYHLMSAATTLIYFAIIQRLINTEKKISIVFYVFTIVYLLMAMKYVDDFVLVGVFLILPICLYVFFWIKEVKFKNQGKYFFLTLAGVLAVGLRFVDEVWEKITGMGLFDKLIFYGGSDYTSWASIQTIVTVGIPSFVQSMLKAWNIPISGDFIQRDSVSWIIRVVILTFAWIGVFRRLKVVFFGDISKMNIVEAFATLSVFTGSLINIFNGTVTWSGNLPIRYASVVWFLLGAFAIWEVEREVSDIKSKCNDVIKYRKIVIGISMSGVMLFVSYGSPFFLSREHFVTNEYEAQIQYMVENNLKYGFGSFWYSTSITALSGGEVQFMWANMDDDGYIPKGLSITPQFNELKNFYNYVFEDLDTPFGVSEERILNTWGKYVDKHGFAKLDEQVHSNIYVYDYDIRWKPVVVKNPNYETEVSVPLGKTRVAVEGNNLSGVKLVCNADCKTVLVECSDNRLVYEIETNQDMDVTLQIINKNENTSIAKMTYYVVNAYKDVYLTGQDNRQDEIKFLLPKGEYYIYIEGDDIKKENYTVTDEGGESIIQDNQIGKVQQKIKINMEDDTVITISGGDMEKISRVVYTDAYTALPEELIVVVNDGE
jgi:hypothetical protein